MGYVKAVEVLPAHLLEELQNYVEGKILYVPKKTERESWGSVSGIKASLKDRNEEIISEYENGMSIEELCNKYYLSDESIRKIVYGRKQL